MYKYHVLYLKAPNDINGNPRGLFTVFGQDYPEVDIFIEDYSGQAVIPEYIRNDCSNYRVIHITAREYNRILKQGM